MLLEVDFNSDQAIYIQLRNQIIVGIACSDIQDGESLPSVRQLAQILGVNMHTVNKAYAILREEGYLKLDRRKGAVVSVDANEKAKQLDELEESLQLLVAQAICKGVTREELYQLVDHVYRQLDKS
ncbi:GntR family transcriptional regulator [Anaerostipes rhamnosivorans]|uniref:Transcriptional regulator, GntR family n=1 Tax=Anaerostipes rhamnosivorans TaxID=1229621 RepID=A0A4P8IGF1_9FIRM|nr:GntR family transcriptional regulator [Anaerostipes rhamnosivorans]QCP36031.1 Transcriptional regulator, GntR family [Anaerostipes rhamnosivorans]